MRVGRVDSETCLLTLLAFRTLICSSFTVSLFFSRKPSHWYSTWDKDKRGYRIGLAITKQHDLFHISDVALRQQHSRCLGHLLRLLGMFLRTLHSVLWMSVTLLSKGKSQKATLNLWMYLSTPTLLPHHGHRYLIPLLKQIWISLQPAWARVRTSHKHIH